METIPHSFFFQQLDMNPSRGISTSTAILYSETATFQFEGQELIRGYHEKFESSRFQSFENKPIDSADLGSASFIPLKTYAVSHPTSKWYESVKLILSCHQIKLEKSHSQSLRKPLC